MRNCAHHLYQRSSDADRVVTVDANGTSHLAATLPQEIPGNVPWFMTNSIAVLSRHECYGPRVEVAALLADVGALLADVGRPRMMTTNSTGNRFYFFNCEHEPWQCHKRIAKLYEGAYIETNCILENTPPPCFGLAVVY